MKTWFEWMDRCYAPPVEEALGTQQEAARLKEKVFAQLHSRPAPAAAPAAQPARPRRLRRMAVLAAADAEVLFLNSVPALSCARPGAAEFTRNLLTILAGRNLTLTRKIGHMARRTTRDKLLSYLSAQAMQAGGPEFDIPLDRQQLADYLAVDRSAMSTALGKLRDEGVLTFQKNHFHLLQQMEQTD